MRPRYKNKTFFVAVCLLPELTNGSVTYLAPNCSNGECWINTQLSFSCEPEYHLFGRNQSTCVESLEWDPPIPTCKGKIHSSRLSMQSE